MGTTFTYRQKWISGIEAIRLPGPVTYIYIYIYIWPGHIYIYIYIYIYLYRILCIHKCAHMYLVNIPESGLYEIYTLKFSFDLKCESDAYAQLPEGMQYRGRVRKAPLPTI